MSHNPSQPLRGETFLLTRPHRSTTKLRDQLIQLGASVVHIPTVELTALKPRIEDIWQKTYCALAFSSQNAWGYFLELLEESSLELPESLPRFSIGPATTEAMSQYGPVIQAQTRSGKGLAQAVWNHFGTTPNPHPVLFPCSKHAHPTFAQTLKEFGMTSERFEIYEPRPCQPGPIPIEVSRPGWVILTSPSAIQGYAEHLHPIEQAKIVCMGPTTKAAAEKAGLNVTLVPDQPGTEELIAAIIKSRA